MMVGRFKFSNNKKFEIQTWKFGILDTISLIENFDAKLDSWSSGAELHDSV